MTKAVVKWSFDLLNEQKKANQELDVLRLAIQELKEELLCRELEEKLGARRSLTNHRQTQQESV